MMQQNLDDMFQQIGAMLDMTMTLSLFQAAKILTNEEFEVVMAICERQFMNTSQTNPNLYYSVMKEFKKLFQMFKNHPF